MADDLYIDLQLTNLHQTSSSNRVLSNFYSSSSQVLLKDTTNYKMAIIRFVLNSDALPVFIPIMASPTDKVKTIYSFTMEYKGVYYQQYLQYEPQVQNVVESEEYYYVLTYQWFVYLINNCLKSCVDGLNDKILLPDNYTYPKMNFDINTHICSISLNDTIYGYNETDKINIYLNYNMYLLFTSLPIVVVNKNANGMDIQLNNLISSDPQILSQEYTTVGLWNPISSVVFTTNLLPIYASTTPPIQLYKDGKTNSSSQYNFLNIITDFVGNSLDFTTNGFLQYDASVYRYIALKDNQQISNIDINVYWINKYDGTLKPIYISPGSFSSIKILLSKQQ